MNIGIFTDTYAPQINGVATSVRMLEMELTRLGHTVYIFTTTDPKAEPSPNIFRLRSMPFVFLPTHRMCLWYSPRILMKMTSLKLDVIHTQTEFSLGILGKLAAEFHRIPLVHTYHTMYEDYVHYIANGHLVTPKLAQQFSRIFCNRAKTVIAPVKKTKQKLLEYGVKRPISIIPTGIDFEPFSPNQYSKEDLLALKQSFGLDENAKILITVGRIAKEKSIDVLIRQMPEIIKQIPTAKYVIVGDGPAKEALEALAKELHVRDSVVFTGAVSWDAIGKYYALGDVFVTASTSETQGLTHIEAMAAHIPVIARRDASFEEVIMEGETGFYFEEEDEAAPVICRLLNDDALRKVTAKKAFEKIELLSSKCFAKNMETLYLSVIETNQSGKPKIPFNLKTIKPFADMKKLKWIAPKK